MTGQITKHEFSRMLAGAAARVREQHLRLSELDSIAGDGDHGATMLRVMDRLEKALAPQVPADFKTCLHQAGWSVLGADGGASSSLLGTFFLGMAGSPSEGVLSLDCAGLAAAFQSGLTAVCKQTKAQPGDKTLVDALMPAVETFARAAQAGKGIEVALGEASSAAEVGAAATKHMTARFGRARLLGEKTRGSQDPGATSVALMFAGFHQGLVESKGEIRNA
jgi:phosphoenolpyruvate---glycerone phosphotransferase subunit DhaL